jgi:CHASE3 domain sensor protein
MYTKNKIEAIIADCNELLSTQQGQLAELAQAINTSQNMLMHLRQVADEIETTTTGSLTEQNITDILSDLNLEDSITSHIHERTDWNDVIKVDLSLSGNEIETEVDADRWEIERYISRDLSSVLEESIREILQNFTTKQEVQNDSI